MVGSKPFFLTFYSSLLFSIYLLGFVFVPKWREDLRLSWRILVLTYTSPRPIWGDQGSERGDANCADGDDLLPLLADETVLVSSLPAIVHGFRRTTKPTIVFCVPQEDGRKLPHEVAWLAFKYSFPWLVSPHHLLARAARCPALTPAVLPGGKLPLQPLALHVLRHR